MIINHTDCGMLKFTDAEMEDRLRKETGQAQIVPARFYSFTDVEENTKEQMQKARSHPWIPQDVPVRGFIFDVSSGRLSEAVRAGGTSRLYLAAAASRSGSQPGGILDLTRSPGPANTSLSRPGRRVEDEAPDRDIPRNPRV